MKNKGTVSNSGRRPAKNDRRNQPSNGNKEPGQAEASTYVPRRKKRETGRPRAGGPPSSPPARPPRAEAYDFNLKVSPKVGKWLGQIGVPEDTPFKPDDFQLLAVKKSAAGDVIVSAPTGSGKTWIAEQAIARELAGGGRVWYASPLKALSNAKFLEFGKIFGLEMVGLLTGDHKVNTLAPLIIGTTEILRNQLYDLMSSETSSDTGAAGPKGRVYELPFDLVILDEAHYLGDRDRGVVWEEIMIYLPPRVRLLLLSATVANADDLAHWLGRGRKKKVAVVRSEDRPVPLAGLCLWPSGDLAPLEASSGPLIRKGRPGRAFFNIQMPNSKIMKALKELDLLPSIFFLKSRADCDAALSQAGGPPAENRERFEARRLLVDAYLHKYPFLADHPHLGRIRRQAIAAHHAGHLPHYKLMVEDLMSRGYLDAIFATSTVSAGVNFPARSVVIRQSDRFDGQGFSDLTATEFTQMTGRAGRRGRDLIGFALMIPGPHMDLRLMAALMNSPSDPVRSGLAMNFSMVLNLLNAYPPEGVRRLLAQSLAAWQRAAQKTPPGRNPTSAALGKATDELYGSFVNHLDFLRGEGLVNKQNRLTADGLWATELRLDHPLVFYAGIRAEAWPMAAPALAACVAALVADKESNQPPPRRKPPKSLIDALTRLVLAVGPMINSLEEGGFTVPNFNLRPAWALWSWAAKGDFDEAVEILGLGAGDLAMLSLRVADHLRQLAGLKKHSHLRAAAYEAISLILKDPVSSPL